MTKETSDIAADQKKEPKRYKSVVKKLRDGVLITLISAIPFTKDIQAQNDNLLQIIGGKDAIKVQKELKYEKNQDSVRFERQKKHFDAADKRDLMRDITVLYYDKENNKYRRREIYRKRSNDYKKWREITKEQFDNPRLLESSYTEYANHILIIDKKYKHLNYKKAKKILDEQRIQARIKQDEEF